MYDCPLCGAKELPPSKSINGVKHQHMVSVHVKNCVQKVIASYRAYAMAFPRVITSCPARGGSQVELVSDFPVPNKRQSGPGPSPQQTQQKRRFTPTHNKTVALSKMLKTEDGDHFDGVSSSTAGSSSIGTSLEPCSDGDLLIY